MGYTLTWKSNFIDEDGNELLVKANYLSQEDAEAQADAYAEAPGAPAPQYVLDPSDDPVTIYKDVDTFEPAPEGGDAGYHLQTQERLEGEEFDTAKAALLVELEPEPEPEPTPE